MVLSNRPDSSRNGNRSAVRVASAAKIHMMKIEIRRGSVLLSIPVIVLLFAACSTSEPVANAPVQEPFEAPFQTEESETYQTFIIQTTPTETARYFIARDGDRWRVDAAFGTPDQTTSLHTDKDYILAYANKNYSELEAVHGYNERPNMVNEISYGLLNSNDKAIYEKIDAPPGNSRFKFQDAKGRENVVTINEAIGIPVKKEIYSSTDGKPTLLTTITLEQFSTLVDPSNFEIPKDFKKVSPSEMKRILSKQ